jgi:thiol-disulfide isomerase/thioredoxin
MQAVAKRPDGREEKLFRIDDWDFNWQGRYNYAEPVRLPRGTIIETTLTYDNSADNPRNPSNPPVPVRWGEGSTDEMGSIGMAFVAVNEADIASYRGGSFFIGGDRAGQLRGAAPGAPTLRGMIGQGANVDLLEIRRQLEARDANHDGKLEGDEIPPALRAIADRIDTDGDGALDRNELRAAILRWMIRRGGAAPAAEPDRGPELKDMEGRSWHPLHPGADARAQVLVFVTPDCPVANQFAPEIGRLARSYEEKGVPFLLVHVDPAVTPEKARDHAREYGLDLPILIDREHALVSRVGPQVTPEAAVIAPGGRVVYCGRIDDRFGKLGRQRPEPNSRDLRDALEDVLAGRPVAHPRAEAIGCPIEDLK